jgi:hypothetical protein
MNNQDPNHSQQQQQQQYEALYGYSTHSPARLGSQPSEITTLTAFPIHAQAASDYATGYDNLYGYRPSAYYHPVANAGVPGLCLRKIDI